MRVDLGQWIDERKNLQIESRQFVGTTIMSLGALKGYSVQILLANSMTIPCKVVQTNEEAVKIQDEIWVAMYND